MWNLLLSVRIHGPSLFSLQDRRRTSRAAVRYLHRIFMCGVYFLDCPLERKRCRPQKASTDFCEK
jgi:hypothetical protein